MRSTVFILFTAAVLLHEVNGHVFQRAIPHVLSKHMELHKRQTDTDPDQCVEDKVNAVFKEDTSANATACKRFASGETDDNGLRAFCNPKCGDVVINAGDECGAFDGPDGASLRALTIALCGTNSNGILCNQLLFNISSNLDIPTCYTAFVADSSVCTCQSELSQLNVDYGCCLGVVYEEVLASVYDETTLRELYSVCGVDYPTACTNSPITGVVPSVVPTVSPDECLEDKVNAAFEGDTSAIANGCRRIADTDTVVPTVADFQAFCDENLKCSNVVLDAGDECKLFDGPEGAQLRAATVGLCGTNSNDTVCYQVLLNGNVNIANCYTAFVADSSVCNCKSDLSQLTVDYGCCLSAVYEFGYNQTIVRALYNRCDVDYPMACTNNPLDGSGVVPQVALVTLISAMIFSVVLG